MFATLTSVEASHKRCLALLRLGVILCMLLNAMQLPSAVRATEDVVNVSPCELESIINQLVNPSAQYQLHASALRNQLKNILRERQLEVGEEQSIGGEGDDYLDEDKRSVASLASHGYLRTMAPKRSLGTLAKNGQLPATSEPDDGFAAEKRYLGSLARSGSLLSYGKRNIGTLARDFQLPQNGKRNVATLARLGLLSPKRNVAAVARYNSNRMGGATATSAAAAEKRNLGALKGSPVHGGQLQQKRADEEAALLMPGGGGGVDLDYVDYVQPGQWLYPNYGDLDWEVVREQQKRFLDTSKDPELFGIMNGPKSFHQTSPFDDDGDDEEGNVDVDEASALDHDGAWGERVPHPQKRHIGSIARSGFLPSYNAFRSTFGSGGGGGGFSRSGRDARQFGEFYPQRERLRQPIAAVCKRCFLPNRPTVVWGGVRRLPGVFEAQSIMSNALPTVDRRPPMAAVSTSWGTPPRITALHRRSFRRPNAIESYQY